MNPTYSIRDWGRHFETYETKRLVYMRWVPVPNKHDGKGFRKIAFMKNATEIYCAWQLMLQLASKCPVRGVLADSDGPMTSGDMQIKTGFPASIFELAFLPLIQNGWLTSDIQIPADSTHVPRMPPADSTGRIEGNGMEGKVTTLFEIPNSSTKDSTSKNGKTKKTKSYEEHPSFNEWYNAYPKHEGRELASASYIAAVDRTTPEELLEAAIRLNKSKTGPDRKFFPMPATWLNQGRWTDEIQTVVEQDPYEKARLTPDELAERMGDAAFVKQPDMYAEMERKRLEKKK